MSRVLPLIATLCACAPNYQSTYNGPRSNLLQPPMLAPPLQRREVIRTETQIDRVRFVATPAGATGWTLDIANEGDESLSIVWDESSFVSASGQSTGRLLRAETRRIDSANAQPPSPLPAGSRLTQAIFPEKTLDVEDEEDRLAGKGPYGNNGLGLQPDAYKAVMDGRADRAKGGRLHVVVTASDRKMTWIGVVEPDPHESEPVVAPSTGN